MGKLQAVWVHGVSVCPQEQGYFTSTHYLESSALFLSHGEHWFHFSLPTPVIVDNAQSQLVKVFLLYKTTLTARITTIHLHDASVFLSNEKHEGLKLGGDHSLTLDASNTWVVASKPHIRFGLALSVCVDFGKDPLPQGIPSIEFMAAGADFETP